MKKRRVIKSRRLDKGKQKNVNLDTIMTMRNDLVGFKIDNSHRMVNAEQNISELRKDSMNFGNFTGAFLDLIADVLNMSPNIINQRFLTYTNKRQIVDLGGFVNGKVIATKYNF